MPRQPDASPKPSAATKIERPVWNGYPDAPARHYPKESNFYKPKDYSARLDKRSVAILCDPGTFRFSIHASADKDSLDPSYPERWLVDKDKLVEYAPNYTGERFFADFSKHVAHCGPFRIRLEGDALNANANGQMGAEDTFASVNVVAGNKWIFPLRPLPSGQSAVRLFSCEIGGGRQSDCPDEYATRIDATYDPNSDTVHFHEFLNARQPADAKIFKVIERKSHEDNAYLNLYWQNR
jgi:hypothetical protein